MSTSASLASRFNSREYPRGAPEARAARSSARPGLTNNPPPLRRSVDPPSALLQAEWANVARSILKRRASPHGPAPHTASAQPGDCPQGSRRSSEAA